MAVHFPQEKMPKLKPILKIKIITTFPLVIPKSNRRRHTCFAAFATVTHTSLGGLCVTRLIRMTEFCPKGRLKRVKKPNRNTVVGLQVGIGKLQTAALAPLTPLLSLGVAHHTHPHAPFVNTSLECADVAICIVDHHRRRAVQLRGDACCTERGSMAC